MASIMGPSYIMFTSTDVCSTGFSGQVSYRKKYLLHHHEHSIHLLMATIIILRVRNVVVGGGGVLQK